MSAPATDLPTAAEFVAQAQYRLDRLTKTLAACDDEHVDPVAAIRVLTRAMAQLAAAVRALAESEAGR